MQTATAEFKAVIEGQQVTRARRVTLYLPPTIDASYQDASMIVESYTPEQQAQTSLPGDAILAFGGFPAAACDVVLSGLVDPSDASKTARWLLGQFSSSSPLYRTDLSGTQILIEEGTWVPGGGRQLLPVFTGEIDSVSSQGLTQGSVTLSCIDRRNKIRTVPDIPSFVGSKTAMWPFEARLTGGWLLDYILRSNGFYTSPPHNAAGQGMTVAATMHGSAWPETVPPPDYLTIAIDARVESFNDPNAPYTVPGFWASQVVPNSSLITPWLSLLDNSQGIYCDGWFLVGATPTAAQAAANANAYSLPYEQAPVTNTIAQWVLSSYGTVVGNVGSIYDTACLEIGGLAGAVNARFNFNRGVPNGDAPGFTAKNIAAGWHHFAVRIRYTSAYNVECTWWADGVQQQQSTFGLTYPTSFPSSAANRLHWTTSVPADTIQVQRIGSTQNTTPPAAPNVFTPTAVLDTSLNRLTSPTPVDDSTDPWGYIQQIVDAEGAFAGFNNAGLFRFLNRDTIRLATPKRVISSASSLVGDITVETTKASTARQIRIPVNVLSVGAPDWVWSAADSAPAPILVPAKGVWQQTVSTDNAVVRLAQVDSGVLPANKQPDGLTYWRACTTADGKGAIINTGITVRVQQKSPTVLLITVANNNSVPVYLVTPRGAGYPVPDTGNLNCLVIGGQFVTTFSPAGDTATADSGVIVDLNNGSPLATWTGQQVISLESNPLRQNVEDVTAWGKRLLIDLYRPRPVLSDITILNDPRLEVPDCITISDPANSQIVADGIIIGIRRLDDWHQTLTVKLLSPPGSWLLGKPGASELGSTTYL